MTQLEAAYIAGFFDGDGWVTMGLAGSGFYIRLGFGQKDRLVLDWICAIIGSSVTISGKGQSKLSSAAFHRLELHGRKAYNVLQEIKPYVIQKHRELNMVVQAWEYHKEGNRTLRDEALQTYRNRNKE